MATVNSINNKTGSLNINGEYSLPTVDGSNGQVMTTDGNGVVTWEGVTADLPSGSIIKTVTSVVSTVETITATIAFDNSIPQKTEGTEIATLSLAPSNTANTILVNWFICGSASSGGNASIACAFFQDAQDDALFATASFSAADTVIQSSGSFQYSPVTTSSITIKMRCGVNSGTFYINGDGSGTRLFGGCMRLILIAQEIKA